MGAVLLSQPRGVSWHQGCHQRALSPCQRWPEEVLGFTPAFWVLLGWETELLVGVVPGHPLPPFLPHPCSLGCEVPLTQVPGQEQGKGRNT